MTDTAAPGTALAPLPDSAIVLTPNATALLWKAEATARQIGAIVGVAPLDTPEREEHAGQLLRAIGTLVSEVETERKTLKAPHLAKGRAVDDAFRAPCAELERVASLIRQRLAQAATARERARAAAMAQVAAAVAAGDAVQANASLVLANDPVFAPVHAGGGSGVSERMTWEAVAFDVRAMPIEFLTVDTGKIKAEIAEANRLGREPRVPGVTFQRTATIVARRFP